MSQNISCNIYVISYRRAETTTTYKHLNKCTYVVREFEADKYREKGIEDILVIPTGAKMRNGVPVNGFMSTFHWIIENTPEDVICILDDDITNFVYRSASAKNVDNIREDWKTLVDEELERLAQLVVDLDLGLLCSSPLPTPFAFIAEFDRVGAPGAIRIINKSCFKATHSDKDLASSDVDMVMQELLKNRIILRCSYFITKSLPNLVTQGGTDNSKNIQEQLHLAMKLKWGRYYQYDEKMSISKIKVKR